MLNHNRERAEYERLPTIIKAVKDLCRSTEQPYSAVSQVEKAFLLGLWYRSFPEYTLEHLEKAYTWSYMPLMPEGTSQYAEPYRHFLRFQFIADTGDSWHQCYRDFRERGWQRVKVHRDGGKLQYLLKLESEYTWAHEGEEGAYKVYDKPEGFQEIHLILDISISTCKQVQIGTEMKEVPIMKTVCEDLVEIQESDSAESVGEVTPLMVVDDIEELQRRRSGEAEDIEELADDNGLEPEQLTEYGEDDIPDSGEDAEILEQSTGHHDKDDMPS